MKPRFRMDRACQGALSGRILFWGWFSHGVAMGSRRSAPCGASDLAKAWAGFLNKAERLIHGVPIANNPENSDTWHEPLVNLKTAMALIQGGVVKENEH